MASQRLRKSKSELSILVKRNQKHIIVYGEENIDKKKKEYEDIENKDHNIYELEKILIYIYENKETLSNDNSDVKNMSIEELGVHLDEEFKREFEKFDLRHRLNTIGDVFFNMEELESYFYWYYYSIGENIQKKEYIEASFERQKEFMKIYEPAEKEYLKDENIFDLNYIIKGKDVKDIKSIEGLTIPRKETPYYCYISQQAKVYLHHSGFNTISDILKHADDQESLKKFVDSISGLKEDDKEKIVKYIIDNGFMNKTEEKEELEPEVEIYNLELTRKIENCLDMAGKRYVTDILELYDAKKKNWNKLFKVRGLGKKSVDEILNKLEEQGFLRNGVPLEYCTESSKEQETVDREESANTEKEKQEIIEDIKEHQEELKELKTELDKQGINLEDTQHIGENR